MRFRVLGTLEISDGTSWTGIGAGKWRSLLATLLINHGTVVSVDRLAAELWGDAPPSTVTNLVHGYVARLRGLLGDGALVTRSPGYVLLAEPQDIDAGRFGHLVERGTHALRTGRPQLATELLTQALDLWRGPAFADVPATELIREETARLEERRLVAVETRLDAELACGREASAISDLEALTRDHPFREGLWVQLIHALHATGRRAEALAAYARVRALLTGELGVEPGPALRQLHHTVLTDDRPVTARQVPQQLPHETGWFVGREEPLATAALWLAGTPSSVAVTGPGGIGKTTFAVHLAHRLRGEFPDGQLFAKGSSGEVVVARFLHALGTPVGDLPKDLDEQAEMLRNLLADRRVLMLVDDAQDETVVRPLIPPPNGCGLLVTSRRRLAGLDAMRSLPLDVLPVEGGITLLRAIAGDDRVEPDTPIAAEVVGSCGGLPLAIKIAAARLAKRPNWTLRDLARRLADARGRLDWLRLGDLGVRTSLAESYASLPDQQRTLLRRLGLLDVREFAAWVPAALLDVDAGHAERLLDDLLEVHLAEPAGHGLTGPRYRIHDLVHLVARELAHETDPDSDRHAAVHRVLNGWLTLAAIADNRLSHWYGLDPEPTPVWRPSADVLEEVAGDPMRLFDEERVNLVRAVHQAADRGYAEVAWPLAQRMSAYLELRGRYDEWREVLHCGLDVADKAADRQGQATMLGLLMQAEAIRDEYMSSVRYGALTLAAYLRLPSMPTTCTVPAAPASPALTEARKNGDALAVGFEVSRLALELRLQGAQCDFLSLFEEAADAFRNGGALVLELWAIKNTGLTYCRQHRFADAERVLRRAQTLLISLGDQTTSNAGGDLAGFAAAHGRFDIAEKFAAETLEHARHSDDQWSAGRALLTLGEVRASQGDRAAAAEAYQAALEIWCALKQPKRVAQAENGLAELA